MDAAPFVTFKGRAGCLAFEERARGVWIFLKGQKDSCTEDDYRKFDRYERSRVAQASGRIV